MSKVGKKPITLPEGITAEMADSVIKVRGKNSELTLPVLPFTKIDFENNQVKVGSVGNDKQARANWGTMRALIQNAVDGVNSGFTKELEIQGVGFRASLEGSTLVLSIGFSHPVKFQLPEGLKVTIEKSFIKISGSNKALVGEVAAKIRSLKKPEPYKGTGIRYRGEAVKLKPGKKVAGATGGAAAK